jgi:hypothetical protein
VGKLHFVNASADMHLHCFQLGAIIDNIAMNHCVYVFEQTQVFSSFECVFPEVELLGGMAKL